jgi:dTDP-4-dehydrorhamnose reductase
MTKKIRKIFLIGADGQLGSDLKKILEKEYETLCPLIDELDITHFDKVREYVEQNKPELIINTAVYIGNVDEMEKDFEGTFLVNTFAVKNLAEICRDFDIPLVHLSSDYIFGGEKKIPYTEEDSPNPINVYGISKLASEYFVKYICQKYFILRPAILFGVALSKHQGRTNLVEKVIKVAMEGKELKFKTDTLISPTYAKELAEVIAKLIKTKYYGIYHITNKGFCSPYEFAKEILKLTKLKAKIVPVTTKVFEDTSGGAKRPLNSALAHKNLKRIGLDEMSHWRDALKKYLIEKGHIK